MYVYSYYIDMCCCFGQALQGIRGALAAMEKWGLLDHLVPPAPPVHQGKPVQVELYWLFHARFPTSLPSTLADTEIN